jgi:hypothetical protein
LSDLPPPPAFGRTGWDVLASSGRWILRFAAAGFILAAAALFYWAAPGAFSSAAFEAAPYLAALLFFPLGWIVSRLTLKAIYRPSYVSGLCLNADTGLVRVMMIPDRRFRSMNTVGDSVMFRGVSGVPVYLIKSIDGESIDFGWIHSVRPELAFSERRLFLDFRSLLEDVVLDNIRIMADPEILAAMMTRSAVKSVLDEMSGALGFSRPEPDYVPQRDADLDPRSVPEAEPAPVSEEAPPYD